VKYPVVYERSDDGGWAAFPPDLPGVGVVGDTRDKVRELVRKAIAMHIAGLREDGLAVPEPFSNSELVDVAL
jgi:predicted RNase H-like HicB family nuclease